MRTLPAIDPDVNRWAQRAKRKDGSERAGSGAGVNVDPRHFPGSERDRYPFVRCRLLVSVRGGELGVGDFEYRATDTTVASPVVRGVGMMRLAAERRDLRIFDPDQRRLESGKLVRMPLQQPSERGQLHVVLLESAVGKQQRHERATRRLFDDRQRSTGAEQQSSGKTLNDSYRGQENPGQGPTKERARRQ
jgi:hypothetical protein